MQYVADVIGNENLIPATPTTEDCPVNEVLIVRFGIPGQEPFARGDVNGNGRVNITDGALCAQNIFLAAQRPFLVFFDCDNMLDGNDDGELNTADPIIILEWVFGLRLPDLNAPFLTCGFDDDTDLTCNESNCQ